MKQTTKMERNALKVFLEKTTDRRRVIFSDSREKEEVADRALRALSKIKGLFSEEDFEQLETLFAHRDILDFKLEVMKIYERNGIDSKTFKKLSSNSWFQ